MVWKEDRRPGWRRRISRPPARVKDRDREPPPRIRGIEHGFTTPTDPRDADTGPSLHQARNGRRIRHKKWICPKIDRRRARSRSPEQLAQSLPFNCLAWTRAMRLETLRLSLGRWTKRGKMKGQICAFGNCALFARPS